MVNCDCLLAKANPNIGLSVLLRIKSPLVSNFHKYSFQETDEPAKANTSDLNEELGQVCNYGLLDYFNLAFLHFAIISKRLDKKHFILVSRSDVRRMNKIFGALLEKVYISNSMDHSPIKQTFEFRKSISTARKSVLNFIQLSIFVAKYCKM